MPVLPIRLDSRTAGMRFTTLCEDCLWKNEICVFAFVREVNSFAARDLDRFNASGWETDIECAQDNPRLTLRIVEKWSGT